MLFTASSINRAHYITLKVVVNVLFYVQFTQFLQ